MQIKLSTSGLLKQKRRHYLVALTAALCLLCFALAQGTSQLKTPRRITGLQIGEAAEGSRVTVTADSALEDYEAFRRGDRFYLRIPSAEFSGLQTSLKGDGFEDVQVQKVGDGVVISFKLQPGASAHVAEGSNRLEVIFFAPHRMASNRSASAVRNRLTGNSKGSRTPRSTPKREADVAGPMPPQTPNGNNRYKSHESQPDVTSTGVASRMRSSNRAAQPQAGVVSSERPSPNSTPQQTATPYTATSEYSSTYPPPTTTSTTASTQTSQRSTDNSSSQLDLRGWWQSARQWISTNRNVSIGFGLGGLVVLCIVIFVLYRRRQTLRKATSNQPRVQPKYSPDVQLEDMLAARVSAASSRVGPGAYVDEDVYESLGESEVGRSEFSDEGTTERQSDVSYESAAASNHLDAIRDESWEFVERSNSQAYESRVREEREVFEL